MAIILDSRKGVVSGSRDLAVFELGIARGIESWTHLLLRLGRVKDIGKYPTGQSL